MEGVMRKGEIKQSSSDASILPSLLVQELSFAFAVSGVSDRGFVIDSLTPPSLTLITTIPATYVHFP